MVRHWFSNWSTSINKKKIQINCKRSAFATTLLTILGFFLNKQTFNKVTDESIGFILKIYHEEPLL